MPPHPQAQMPIQSPTPLQVRTALNQVNLKQQQPQMGPTVQVRPQMQLHQGTQLITVPAVQFQLQSQQGGSPGQPMKLQLPIQIQQQGVTGQASMQHQEIQNVVTLQTASVQEQLQRIQQLREQQQQKKRQQQEAKREQQQQAISQSELIQKQVRGPPGRAAPASQKIYSTCENRAPRARCTSEPIGLHTHKNRPCSFEAGRRGPSG